MYAQVEKPKANKGRTVANSVVQKKSDVEQGFGFVDNRVNKNGINALSTQNANLNNRSVTQLLISNKSVTRPLISYDWHDDPWLYTKDGGTGANDYGQLANDAVVNRGADVPPMMSAHLVPKRLGGKGNATNMVPWPVEFENGIWKTDMEDEFDRQIMNLDEGDAVSYNVNTVELGRTLAAAFINDNDRFFASEGYTNEDAEILRIARIPMSVVGTINGVKFVDHKFNKWW